MKLFKCLVPVLVLLFVEGSSATWCLLHQFLPFHLEYSELHRMCDVESKQQDGTSRINYFSNGATESNGDGTAISIGTINKNFPDRGSLFPTNNDLGEVADSRSKVNHIPNQGTVPEQSGPPGQWIFVPFEAVNVGGGAGPSTSASKADASAGSNGVGGFGENAGNSGIISGGRASSGSGLGGYGGSNAGSFGADAKTGAVVTATAGTLVATTESDFDRRLSGGSRPYLKASPPLTVRRWLSHLASQQQRTARVRHPAMLRPAQASTSNR